MCRLRVIYASRFHIWSRTLPVGFSFSAAFRLDQVRQTIRHRSFGACLLFETLPIAVQFVSTQLIGAAPAPAV